MKQSGLSPASGSKRSLYLHIGSEKTGTASLHLFLANNREQLKREDFTYLDGDPLYYSKYSRCHSPLVASFFETPPDFIRPSEYAANAHVLSRLKEDLSHEKRNVIISSEHFSSRLRSRDDLETLRQALEGFTVYVVFYMRPQYELYFSSYSTAIINGKREAIDPADVHVDNSYLNYIKLLAPWSQVFGKQNIIVRNYRRLLTQNICDDFLSLLGLRNASDFNEVSRANRSLTPQSAEMIRRLNAFLPRHGETGYALYSTSIQLRWLVNSWIRLFCHDDRTWNAPLKLKIESTFDRLNKELFDTYADHIKLP